MPEEQNYISLKELATDLGIERASVYHYLHALGIRTRKFKLNRNAYITKEQAEHIKRIRERPWEEGSEREATNG